MKQKEKKCRGTGKSKGYGCGNLSLWRKYGLCKRCFADWLYNTSAGKENLSNLKIRAKKKVKIQEKKEQRELKEKHKSIAKLIQEARKPFQEFIRIRDANLRCISCGKQSETYDAGHYYKAELYTGLIFDEQNVNKQCVYCNKYLDGNESGYRLGLIKKYGAESILDLDERARLNKTYKFTREELIGIKKLYSHKVKQLKSK